ncbi:hypothetical protein KY290_013649 [Solanum tuberosum]|uniref:Reverse transcriptase domain-containing protein n=1 Tax=Solanum tuberosum TaxID=4113 RepID=A0ABQ7VME8_SOLTU|nr:hypothetical protein KY290_013649 [Solanum tuberosum]
MLNSQYRVPAFRGFSMHPYGPQINHLSFADDTIVFSSGRKATLQAILKTLESYERISGQSINKNKCSYTMAPTTPLISIKRVGKILRMRYEHLPIKYMGCPIYNGRKLLEIFIDLICKITNRIKGWHLKLLSTGGRATLIRHVLLALNVHSLAAVHPPKGTLEVIERYLTRFYWSGNEEDKKYHRVSWENLSYPYNEGGSNFRKLEDTCKAFTAKQWWRFRTTESLWTNFLKAKYCSVDHPTIVQWKPGQSHSWQAMLKIREEVEQEIFWKTNRGNSSFWFDKWNEHGPLYELLENTLIYQHITIKDVFQQGHWNWNALNPQPPDHIKHIITNFNINLANNLDDIPLWTAAESGKFSVSSAGSF